MTLLEYRPGGDWRRSGVGRGFTLFWIALYAAGLASSLWRDGPLWAWIVCGIGVAGWVAYLLLPEGTERARLAIELVMIATGGAAAVQVNLVAAVALAMGLTMAVRRIPRPRWSVPVAIALALASVGVGALVARPWTSARPWLVLGALAVIAIALLLGFTRRQSDLAVLQARQLELERARSERLDDHARVARELHDVLAHGLGGLVVQLDAVDALLESGRVDEAAERVRAARGLARDGLVDARRAVDALRGDAEDAVPADRFAAELDELIEAHRMLGGVVDARLEPGGDSIPGPVAAAVRRALQEALVNARKHAPGQPVTVRLDRREGRLALSVENPMGPSGELARTGGGRGLEGMRERFERIAGGSVAAGESGGMFRVAAEAAA